MAQPLLKSPRISSSFFPSNVKYLCALQAEIKFKPKLIKTFRIFRVKFTSLSAMGANRRDPAGKIMARRILPNILMGFRVVMVSYANPTPRLEKILHITCDARFFHLY